MRQGTCQVVRFVIKLIQIEEQTDVAPGDETREREND